MEETDEASLDENLVEKHREDVEHEQEILRSLVLDDNGELVDEKTFHRRLEQSYGIEVNQYEADSQASEFQPVMRASQSDTHQVTEYSQKETTSNGKREFEVSELPLNKAEMCIEYEMRPDEFFDVDEESEIRATLEENTPEP